MLYLIKRIPGNASIFWCFIGWIWTNNNMPSSCRGRRYMCQEFLTPCLAYGPSKKSSLLLESNVCVICLFSLFLCWILSWEENIIPKTQPGFTSTWWVYGSTNYRVHISKLHSNGCSYYRKHVVRVEMWMVADTLRA